MRIDLYTFASLIPSFRTYDANESYFTLNLEAQSILLMQTARYANEVEEKKKQCEHYNILPLYAVGVKPAIMKLPEVVYKLHM